MWERERDEFIIIQTNMLLNFDGVGKGKVNEIYFICITRKMNCKILALLTTYIIKFFEWKTMRGRVISLRIYPLTNLLYFSEMTFFIFGSI